MELLTSSPVKCKLGSYFFKGPKAIENEFGMPPKSDEQARQRLFLIDYLKYRAGWDLNARETIKSIISTKISDGTPSRYRASTLVDKAELVGALAFSDPNSALEIIQQTNDTRLKGLSSVQAIRSFVRKGMPYKEAVEKVRSVHPELQGS